MPDDLATRLAAALDRAEAEVRACTEGPWWFDESDDCWRLHGVRMRLPAHGVIPEQIVNAQILKAPKRDTPYAEYWPTAADGAHVVAWNPAVVLRLIERDRALLVEHQALAEHADIDATVALTRAVLGKEVERAAAFWGVADGT